jgi:hypothetical protein
MNDSRIRRRSPGSSATGLEGWETEGGERDEGRMSPVERYCKTVVSRKPKGEKNDERERRHKHVKPNFA